MKAKTIAYWTTTALLAFALLSGGVAQLLRRPENVQGLADLGYPVYLLTILGTWKLLGALALLVPRLPRLKEWAYAGAFFELTGAAASHALAGSNTLHVVAPSILALIALASWALRPPSRTLGTLAPELAAAIPSTRPRLAT